MLSRIVELEMACWKKKSVCAVSRKNIMSEATCIACGFRLLFTKEMHRVPAIHVLLKLLEMEAE